MRARFFVDENDLALGKALAELHGNVVFPGHPDLPELPRQSGDGEWLGVVGAEELVVIPVPANPLSARRKADVGRASGAGLRSGGDGKPVNRRQPRSAGAVLDEDGDNRGGKACGPVDVRRHAIRAASHLACLIPRGPSPRRTGPTTPAGAHYLAPRACRTRAPDPPTTYMRLPLVDTTAVSVPDEWTESGS